LLSLLIAPRGRKIDQGQSSLCSKIQSLYDQASKAPGDAKARLEKRIDEIKVDHQIRSEKLGQAWHLTKEAFGTALHR